MENSAPVLVVAAQVLHIDKIAVMGHGKRALDVGEGQGLGVLTLGAAGGGVAHMAHRHSAAQTVQDVGGEHVPHQPHILMAAQLQAVHSGNAAGLLPPVL